MRVRVKVCCIGSINEAQQAINAGADALGLVGAMPSGPGTLDDPSIREIADTIPPPIASFLLTSRVTAADIIDHVKYCRTNTVQIVSHIEPSEYPAIVNALPVIRRVQVIHVEDESALELINVYSPYVDAFLLDSGRPNATKVELGGTGRTHDWNISAKFVAASNKPVFLAGGLKPANAAEAVQSVKAYGLDLCSGVRTDNVLDTAKLNAFMRAIPRPK